MRDMREGDVTFEIHTTKPRPIPPILLLLLLDAVADPTAAACCCCCCCFRCYCLVLLLILLLLLLLLFSLLLTTMTRMNSSLAGERCWSAAPLGIACQRGCIVGGRVRWLTDGENGWRVDKHRRGA